MKVFLESYSYDWPRVFSIEKDNVNKALTHLDPIVEHIGSTSVEGMVAKPLIDILVGVVSQEDLDKTVPAMLSAGYSYVSKFEDQMPYRRFFVAADLTPQIIDAEDSRKFGVDILPKVNIHIIPVNSIHFIRHIAFREYLKTHEDIKQQYSELKQKIALNELTDHNEYNSNKNDYIKEVEVRALEWYQGLNTNP